MNHRVRRFALLSLVAVTPVAGWAYYRETSPGREMTAAATEFVQLLDDEQRKTALLSYEDDARLRVDWHFIPMEHRKGLQIKHMTPEQRQAALALLKSALSQVGYDKAVKIMEIEKLLDELERARGGGRNVRDPERYYYTLFGPEFDGRWGLSIEGHHLSLNFVIESGTVIASTPQFFAANPATVKTENRSGIPVGRRILADEEQLAFDLINELDEEQRKTAVIAEEAPREIRAAGEAQPPTDPPAGIPAAQLSSDQQQRLRRLIEAYVNLMPAEIARERMTAIDAAGFDGVHFAWAGAREPGVGHYYRVQGETFLIEFVNTQPDSAGNPANHIHCVWRDMRGDFAIPVE
jgi:hypothetical protein